MVTPLISSDGYWSNSTLRLSPVLTCSRPLSRVVEKSGDKPRTEITWARPATRWAAGQAGDRFGDGDVRQLADIFRGNGFDDRGGIFFDGDGVFDTAADTGHGHGSDRCVGRRRGAGLRLGRHGGHEHGARCGDRAQLEEKAGPLSTATLGCEDIHVSP